MKKIVLAVLDTETCPIVKKDKVDAHNMLTYDIGYSIVDLHGNVFLERSFVVTNTFFGEEHRMNSSYYANKLPQYRKDMAKGSRLPRTWNEIREIIKKDFEEYGVTIACAHNAYFDYTTLNVTKKYFDENYLLPYGIEWWDTMKMARSTIGKKKSYRKFCEEYGFMTKRNQPQLKAETLYRYITKNPDFKENHTGLEDVKIEREILWACLKMHKKMERKLWKD